MSESTTPGPEKKRTSLFDKIKRGIGARVNRAQVKVAEYEQRGYEAHAAESFDALVSDAKGINRQASEAIKDMVEIPGSNRELMAHLRSEAEGKVAEWSTAMAFGPQLQQGPYTALDSKIQPTISFGGLEVPVSQLHLSVQRKVNKLGQVGEPYTQIMINGSKPSEAAPNANKWMITVAPDGSVESALANIKSQSPNGLSPVDVSQVEGLNDMMTQVHFAIWEHRNSKEAQS